MQKIVIELLEYVKDEEVFKGALLENNSGFDILLSKLLKDENVIFKFKEKIKPILYKF